MPLRNARPVAVTAALASLVLAIAIQPAKAAVIAWGSPVTITGSTDIYTAGTLHASANFGSASNQTVSGVTFTGFPITAGTSATVGDITIARSGTVLGSANLSSSTNPFNSLPTQYKSLLTNAMYNSGTNPTTITISGLTVGQTYGIQYWASDSRTNGANRAMTLSGSSPVTLIPNTTNVGGGVGQYVLGQFVADAATQSFVAEPSVQNFAYANALQVRLVPEPSTVAVMAAAGGVATILRLRRSRRVASPAAAS